MRKRLRRKVEKERDHGPMGRKDPAAEWVGAFYSLPFGPAQGVWNAYDPRWIDIPTTEKEDGHERKRGA
jgi:hypothetical protein